MLANLHHQLANRSKGVYKLTHTQSFAIWCTICCASNPSESPEGVPVSKMGLPLPALHLSCNVNVGPMQWPLAVSSPAYIMGPLQRTRQLLPSQHSLLIIAKSECPMHWQVTCTERTQKSAPRGASPAQMLAGARPKRRPCCGKQWSIRCSPMNLAPLPVVMGSNGTAGQPTLHACST